MRVKPIGRPINRTRFSTIWIEGTAGALGELGAATVLWGAAAAATLAIGFRDPRVEYGYEAVIFLLASSRRFQGRTPVVPGLALSLIAIGGFLQLAFGATVYRNATLEGSLRFAALAVTAWVSFGVFGSLSLRIIFLQAFLWLGVAVAVISTLAYFTSPGKILWTWEAPYPDVWGPFLSRNNFAQFLELAMPVALWFALCESSRLSQRLLYQSLAAIMLGAGLASASRAGACVLVTEAVVLLWMHRNATGARRIAIGLFLATVLFASISGAEALVGRFREADPYQDRREIAQSAIKMISQRPWTGFGLGTFATVYPEFALFDVGQKVEYAHNDWLEWATEGGIPWALAWLGLALWSAGKGLRVGWGIGPAACFLHAIVDYPFARFGISAWAFILLGMLAATNLREVRRPVH